MTTEEIDREIQDAAEAHLRACNDTLVDDYSDNPEEWPESPAMAPYCGCETCQVREVIGAAWPVIEQRVIRPHGQLRYEEGRSVGSSEGFLGPFTWGVVLGAISCGLTFLIGYGIAFFG